MALKIDVICSDSILYIEMASAVERGDMDGALGPMSLNLYPIVLAGLHHCGLDWLLAGKLWGVLLASLTVLPLYGWLRRQFGERIAIAGGLLYSAHPKFIEWSPELMRDQTFWFLAALSLYLAWRAATEDRWLWYIATGIALTGAVLTRFEGWLLYIPAILWSCLRCWASERHKMRPVLGLLLCLAAYPLLVGAVHATWLRDYPQRRWGDFYRLEIVRAWIENKVGIIPQSDDSKHIPISPPSTAAPSAAVDKSSSPEAVLTPATVPVVTIPAVAASESHPAISKVPFPPSTVSPTRRNLAGLFVHTMRRGLDATYAVLMFGGLWVWRRVWLRREYQPVFYTTLCVLASICVHLSIAGQSSSRYALLIVILAMPFAAAGLLSLAIAVAGRARGWRSSIRVVLLVGGLAAIIGIGWGDALTSQEPTRKSEAALGKWLHAGCAAGASFATVGPMPLVAFYAQSSPTELPPHDLAAACDRLKSVHAEFVVLSRKRIDAETLRAFLRNVEPAGLLPLEGQALPPNCRHDFLVLKQASAAPR